MPSYDELQPMRHTAAHLLAAAVRQLWPEAQNAIGPAIDNGFYQDFDMGGRTISEADFPKIEAAMRDILATWDNFVIQTVSVEQAKKDFAWNRYKTELIEDFANEGKTITETKQGDFLDLCRGGHLEHPNRELGQFKLLSVAGAYWHGDEKQKMLTRIYGTVWPTQAELDQYLAQVEEARQRDHRKLGKELGLFTFSETVGKGLPLWTEKGATLRRILERFVVDEEIRRGYKHVFTPDIANLALYQKSGHYPYYKDSMYAPIVIDDEEYMLRPMSCPHHFELFLSEPRSYKDLPMRYAEVAKLYRYEQSGELSGLIRLRSFSLADAHIICADVAQAKEEVARALDLIEYFAQVFGLKMGENYWYRLSLGDRADDKKYAKNDAAWEAGEAMLRAVLTERNAEFVEAPGEAAFYGPKIDIQMRNVNGKEDTAFTVQYDFVMPERFRLEYIGRDGVQKQPVVVHRSSIGAIERIIAFLIEYYAGKFPLWLAPVQTVVIPVSEKVTDYAHSVLEQLTQAGLRIELAQADVTLGKNIRSYQEQKVPYMLIVGAREAEEGTVSVRSRDTGDQGAMKLDDFMKRLADEPKIQ